MAFETVTDNGDGVRYTRQELIDMQPIYKKIDIVLAGEEAVKKARAEFLPMPNAEDDSEANCARYNSYVGRAVFYPVASRTVEGLNGFVFARDPVIEVPAQLKDFVSDSDGAGVGIIQSAKTTLNHILSHGRSGLFIDYPKTEGSVTVEQLAEGNIRPTIIVYKPRHIRNWRTMVKGSKTVLSLVVLEETHDFEDDSFKITTGVQFRVLRLEVGAVPEGKAVPTTKYKFEIWRGKDASDTEFSIVESGYPTDSKGDPLEDIAFTFVGSKDNTASIDRPPILDLVNVNLGHYRNSADYEEAVFITGQPTLVLAGLTQQWYEDVMDSKVAFGSRSGIVLNVGGTATLLQCQPNTLPMEGMKHKEEQMLALGAKLIEPNSSTKTATEAQIDDTSETSILSACAKNVEAAYLWALQFAALFAGVPENTVEFSINTNFDLSVMDAPTRLQLMKEWQAGQISFTEMRANLRQSGVTTQEDDVAQKEIQEAEDSELQRQRDAIDSGLAANTIDTPPTNQNTNTPPNPKAKK